MKWGLQSSLYIDTDGYTDRDRLMFGCGVEFHMVMKHMTSDRRPLDKMIHRENESRIRMLAGQLKRRCTISPSNPKDDPNGRWSRLRIEGVDDG